MKLGALSLLTIRFFCQAWAVLEPGSDPSPINKCKSKSGEWCATRAEISPAYWMQMPDGDPCHKLNKEKTEGVCYPKQGDKQEANPYWEVACTCEEHCGCGKDPPILPPEWLCDNHVVPETFDVKCSHPFSNDSTMCTKTGMGAKCVNKVCARGLNDTDKMEIVDAHNEWRRKLAKGNETGVGGVGMPPASNMYKIYWSDELAEVAQRWADQCDFSHDPSKARVIEPNFTYVGQNSYYAQAKINYLRKYHKYGVAIWYGDVSRYDAKKVEKYTYNKKYDEFSQVVWANTKYVGCGFIRFKDPEWFTMHFFCNYAPKGNWPNEKMYKIGKAATNCTKGSMPDDGLCEWQPKPSKPGEKEEGKEDECEKPPCKNDKKSAGDRSRCSCKILLGSLLILMART